MLVAIVPVKSLRHAKSRLARLLTGHERRALVLAMLDDVLAALAQARGVDRIGVISAEPAVLGRAVARGAEALLDTAPDLNAALAQAAGHFAAVGAAAALVLPTDVPLATPSEIEQLIAAQAQTPGVALVPARDGGTNALLLRPPLALPFLFGPNSLNRHVDAARQRGVAAQVVRARGLALDIDRPDDLLLLAERDGETATQRLARELCVAERVMCV